MAHEQGRETRHIALARALEARLYVDAEGRVFAAAGPVQHEKLAKFLSRQDRVPKTGKRPAIEELGIACDGEVSQHLLRCIRGAALNWRRELEAESLSRSSKRRGAEAVAAERREIDRLDKRLATLRKWSAEQARGETPAGAPFFLDGPSEAALGAALESATQDAPLPPLIVWHARLVHWLTGDIATRRYLNAMRELFGDFPFAYLRESASLLGWVKLPAALAALAACDGSAAPIPRRCFRAREQQQKSLSAIAQLGRHFGEPEYDRLLEMIDQLPANLEQYPLGQLWRYVSRGASLADAGWVCEQRLANVVEKSAEAIDNARRLSEAFATRGAPLDADELRRLLKEIRAIGTQAPIDAWLDWLGAVPPSRITRSMRSLLATAFWKWYLPSVRRRGGFDHIAGCLTAPFAENTDSAPLIARIADYQRIAGKHSTRPKPLPKSLRKLLESRERRNREREHLRAKQATDALDSSARARLRSLEAGDETKWSAAKLKRAAEEAYLILGIEAQRAIAERLAEASCREHLGDLAASISREYYWELAGWIDRMNDGERDRLRGMIDARIRHGREYKRFLPYNQPWIAAAEARGVDLAPWFAARSEEATIDGRTMTISIVSDLHRIFLMGEYFQTCLGLGGCNDLAVLANAGDANKQVVFLLAVDETGRQQVIARQLIAVSSEFHLVGYCCYLSWRAAEERQRGEAVQAMAAYCGRLASRMKIELADRGSPEDIDDHFWHDDGECQWPAAARSAWQSNEIVVSRSKPAHIDSVI